MSLERLKEIYDLLIGEPTPDDEIEAQKEIVKILEDLINTGDQRFDMDLLKNTLEIAKNWDTLENWFAEVPNLSDNLKKIISAETKKESKPESKIIKPSETKPPTEKLKDEHVLTEEQNIRLSKEIATAIEEATKNLPAGVDIALIVKTVTEKVTKSFMEREFGRSDTKETDKEPKTVIKSIKKHPTAPSTSQSNATTKPTAKSNLKLDKDKIIKDMMKQVEKIGIDKKSKKSKPKLEPPKIEIPKTIMKPKKIIPKKTVIPIQINVEKQQQKQQQNPIQDATKEIASKKSSPTVKLSEPKKINIPKPKKIILPQSTTQPKKSSISKIQPSTQIKLKQTQPKSASKIKVVKISQPKQNSGVQVEKPSINVAPQPKSASKVNVQPISKPQSKVTPIVKPASQKSEIPRIKPAIPTQPKPKIITRVEPVSTKKKSVAVASGLKVVKPTDIPVSNAKQKLFETLTQSKVNKSKKPKETKIGGLKAVNIGEGEIEGFSGVSKISEAPKEDFEYVEAVDIYANMTKDELYQELIALQGKKFAIERRRKDMRQKHEKGMISDIEYKTAIERLRYEIDNISQKINDIRKRLQVI
ncbi:MAG: hypothetical protein ACTSRZ_02385 [Promethearchaeota archaeon]